MSNELIQLTALLTKANLLLAEVHTDLCYGLRALQTPPEEKKPLSESTKEWLVEKKKKQINDLDEFICMSGKFLFPAACDTNEIQKQEEERWLNYIRGNSKVKEWLNKKLSEETNDAP